MGVFSASSSSSSLSFSSFPSSSSTASSLPTAVLLLTTFTALTASVAAFHAPSTSITSSSHMTFPASSRTSSSGARSPLLIRARPRRTVVMETPLETGAGSSSSSNVPPPGTGPYQGPSSFPLLDSVRYPHDMKRFDLKDLKQLAHELRWDTLHHVSKTGGHLGSSLGVIELTVALHYVFNTPDDRIVWDVSHQVYPHKILTGRRDRMHSLRQTNGLSGFAKRSESEYDAFGAGHSSTSISAALGMSVGKLLTNKRVNNCVAVIGDGAITGGMAFEALNNAGYLRSRMVVILNDNGQVSLPTGTHSAGGVVPAGALSSYTSRLLSSKPFQDFRSFAKGLNRLMPSEIQDINAKLDEYARGLIQGGTLFEELGFYYIGPVDGHDLDNLVPILENLRDSPSTKPVLLHVKTEKGYGYPPAEVASDKYHGVAKFDVSTGRQFKGGNKGAPLSLTTTFANALCEIAAEDRTVVGITAAMPGGTGMDIFGKRFPKRTFDVGIAEQHAVTFAAGMAIEGLKPFCCIYSTFMQRGYDQVIHDVVIQKLPVRMILDRAGLVGNDGPTHHGSFDLSYLGALPDIVIMAPSDELELMNLLETAYETNDLPSVVRYPRGAGYGLETLKSQLGYEGLEELPKRGKAVARGKGRIIRRSTVVPPTAAPGTCRVALLSVGTRLLDTVHAAKEIEENSPGVSVTVADARFVKPLDKEMVSSLAMEHDVLITVEENSVGGFGSFVQQFLLNEGLLDGGKLRLRSMVLPDRFIEAGPQSDQYDQAGLAARHIVEKVEGLVRGREDRMLQQEQHQPQQHQQQQQQTGAGVGTVAEMAGVGAGKSSSSSSSSSRQGTSFQVLP